MKYYLLVAILLSGLFAIFFFKTKHPSGAWRLDTDQSSINTHSISKTPDIVQRGERSFDSSIDSYLTTASLSRLLSNTDLELNRVLNELSQIQVSSILNALGRMASSDINTRGDYNLANRLIGGLEHGNSAEILQWVFHSKSPYGCEFDFREQSNLVSKFSNGKPGGFLQSKFLRSFGSLQGEDAAKSGTVFLLNNFEYLSYIEGVCDTSREAAFGNLELIRDNALREMAVERAATSLLSADAVGFSTFLGKTPPSDTKDLAVLQMIKWLAKKNAQAECPAWLKTITSPTVKARAEQVISTDASK